jgi:single-strand DNA-binding protein
MNGLNQCNFIGNLARDPETKFTAGGDAICNFSIGCGWKTKTKEGTEWVNISTFGKLAEICQQYLKKGSQVYVSGKLKTDKYEKDGVTKYSTKISADTIQFLGKSESKPATKDEYVDDSGDIPF